MKTLELAAAVTLALLAGLSMTHAEETGKPAAPPASAGHQMGGMDMSGMMMSDERLKQKQEHLLKMHELSTKILAATNPQEKDKLKAEQLQLMKEHEKQHHMMMQQHMQDMMKNKGGMPGMQQGGPAGGMGNMQHGGSSAGGMGNMQHGATPPTTPPAMAH
jgi:hypothetical protein